MDENNNKTIEAYEQGIEDYNAAALPVVTSAVKGWIDTGLSLLQKNAKILELGSAHGRDAQYIESKGFVVNRTDATKAFVDFLRLQGYKAEQLNALTSDYGGPYDMIYANAVFLHFTPQQLAEVLQKTRKELSVNGLLCFSVKIGNGSEWSHKKLKMPRFFHYWQEEPLRSLLSDAQFEVIFWDENNTGHDNSDWYHVIARKL